jgi:hypothetical protein
LTSPGGSLIEALNTLYTNHFWFSFFEQGGKITMPSSTGEKLRHRNILYNDEQRELFPTHLLKHSGESAYRILIPAKRQQHHDTFFTKAFRGDYWLRNLCTDAFTRAAMSKRRPDFSQPPLCL